LNLKILPLSAQCIRDTPSAMRYASPPRGVRKTREENLGWMGVCVREEVEWRKSDERGVGFDPITFGS
jgi:hypothetical protein